MAFDSDNVRQTNYDGTWDVAPNAKDLGGVDDWTPKHDMVFAPVKIGSAGAAKLDDIFQGLGDDASIEVIVREVTLQRIKDLVPWAGASAPYDLTPPLGTKMAQYAKQLLLHPRDKADTTEDVTYYKTVPVQSLQLERNGVKQDAWKVRFNIYPDPAKIEAGENPYYTIG